MDILQSRRYRLRSLVVEAHGVLQRAPLRMAKQTRPWIARLWPRRHGAHFAETESEQGKRPHHFGVLVEPRRQTHGIREAKPEQLLGKSRIACPAMGSKPASNQRQARDRLQVLNRETVCGLGIQMEE